MTVYNSEKVVRLIDKYKLRKQYIKACQYIESGNYKAVDLKLRKPKKAGIYQFRITKNIGQWPLKTERT